jgi:hypothetical protein
MGLDLNQDEPGLDPGCRQAGPVAGGAGPDLGQAGDEDGLVRPAEARG